MPQPTTPRASTHAAAIAKALAHPVRMRALELLNEGPTSPSAIARDLDMPIANVAYHVSQLHRAGLIEVEAERAVRGAVEHVYRVTSWLRFSQDDLDALDEPERASVQAEAVRAIVADHLSAVARGDVLRRRGTQLMISAFELDEQAWEVLSARLDELMDEAHALEVAARQRLAAGEAGGAGVSAHLSLSLYDVDRHGRLARFSG